jgi:DNA-nicking Smr family endonuclease
MSNKRPITPKELREWVEETKRDTVYAEPPTATMIEAPMPAQEPPMRLPAEASQPPQAPSNAPQKQRSTAPRTIRIGDTHAMDKQLARRFKRGELALDATLDLHGMHADAACEAVLRFIPQQHARGARHVCIITGKGLRGEGVLRAAIEAWLNMPSVSGRVIAAVHGKSYKGGEGAVYVLLKRHGRTQHSDTTA